MPHLAGGRIVTSTGQAVEALSAAREEMDKRYDLIAQAARGGCPALLGQRLDQFQNLVSVL